MSKFSKLLKNPYVFFNDSPAYQTIKLSLSSVRPRYDFQKNISLESLKNDLSAITPIVVTKESFLEKTLQIGILKGTAHTVYQFLLCLHKQKGLHVLFYTKQSPINIGKLGIYKFIKELNIYGEVTCKIGVIKLNISYWVEKQDCYESINDHVIAKRIYKSSFGTMPFKKGNVFYLSKIFPSKLSQYYNFKIDAVYTWVDHADDEWRKLYVEYKNKQKNSSSESNRLGRFFNRDELKYSLRSLELYAPWINNVYIVTNCRLPSWLNIDNPRIRIVRHEEIMPLESLPTFNSHAIEANLHKIAGLSNYFLYLNDDFFFYNNVKKEDFFLSNGVSISNLEPYGVVNGVISKNNPDYINAAINGQKLLADKFNITPTQLHQHSPYALRKDILNEICSIYTEAVSVTTFNRFRSKTDISIPSFLYHHYSYIKKQSSISHLAACYIGYKKRVKIKKLVDKDAKTICINDGGSSYSDDKWNERIKYYLESTYKNKCEFEI